MLTNPTLDKLQSLKLYGMKNSYQEQLQQSDIDSLSFDERLGLMVDREIIEQENRRLKRRLKNAKIKQGKATIEDINYHHPRGLNKLQIMSLASCQWIKAHQNILIVGPTGTGKTYLACALAHKACLEGYTSIYHRMSRLLPDLAVAKGVGAYMKELRKLHKVDVLILDDWGLMKMTAENRRDLLEILDDRHENRSTIVTGQLPIKHWHQAIDDNTLADAILDRLIHNAHRIVLEGDSMRKIKAKMQTPTVQGGE